MAENIALTEAVYFILLSLVKPLHGYGIMQLTEQMSAGRVRLAAGTLYGALNSLCDKEWIRELPVQAGSRKKEYVITETGREALETEIQRLKQLVQAGEAVIGRGEA